MNCRNLVHQWNPTPFLAVLGFGLFFSATADESTASPSTTPPGDTVVGVAEARVSLDGTWRFLLEPPADYWSAPQELPGWQPILVPGEPQMQGFEVKNDREFAYQRNIEIPADYAGKRVFVRFEGVYGEARVWVNGRFIRNHLGSFTAWEIELTDHITPGGTAVLTVGVTDRTDDISAGTGYAKHPIGGILRGVTMLARPRTYLRDLRVESRLTDDFQKATVKLTADMAFGGSREATLRFTLCDPAGREIVIPTSALVMQADQPVSVIEIPLSKPHLWDAEHPRLYTLTTRCFVEDKETFSQTRAIGIRELRWGDGKLLVNGANTKLRGACRHDMHPMLGRVATAEYEAKDVALLKEANVNFVRTSHYPPSENFLRLCDEQGLYVECETAVCFNDTWVDEPYKAKLAKVAADPAYTPWYLGQLREMVEEFRNHPSVIIWSAGNENMFGMNFDKSLDLIRELDDSRPVIFSYSQTARWNGVPDRFDLTSIHYPTCEGMNVRNRINENMRNWRTDSGRPSIGDEWAHVACYMKQTLECDPGIQDFWGETIDRMWTSCFNSQDGIGGSIWGYVDETFQLPARVAGYGPWGIVDTWRRKKPEFWNTRKAYSPVRVMEKELNGLKAGVRPSLAIQNRYNHTDLADLTVRWKYMGQSGSFTPAALPPRATGMQALPALPWRDGTSLELEFVEADGRLAETCVIAVGLTREKELPEPAGSPARLRETATEAIVTGEEFSLTFDKATGQIREARRRGETILSGGPLLNLSASEDPGEMSHGVPQETLNVPFKQDSFSAVTQGDFVRVTSRGKVGERLVTLVVTVSGNGRMAVDFQVSQARIFFGQECGLAFVLAPGFTDIDWRCDVNLWTDYPPDHIGRLAGSAPMHAPELVTGYREAPKTQVWALDSQDYFLAGIGRVDGSLTRDAKSVRQFIRRYTVKGPQRQVSVIGSGIEGARLRRLPFGEIALVVNTAWDYMDLDWGGYERGLVLPKEINGRVLLDIGK